MGSICALEASRLNLRGFFPLSLPELELNLVYSRFPLRTKCNTVKEKGCHSGPGLEGSESEHDEHNDRLHLLQKEHGLCMTPLQLPCRVLHAQHVGLTALVWPQETGENSGRISHCMHNCLFAIQTPSYFPNSLLSGMQTWFPCLPAAFKFPTTKVSPCWENPYHLCLLVPRFSRDTLHCK